MNVFISRLIASVVSAGATWIAARFVFLQFLLEPEMLAALIALCQGFALAVYAVVHKQLSKSTNPADTAKAPEAAAQQLGVGNGH